MDPMIGSDETRGKSTIRDETTDLAGFPVGTGGVESGWFASLVEFFSCEIETAYGWIVFRLVVCVE
jgi:hypothetical protein